MGRFADRCWHKASRTTRDIRGSAHRGPAAETGAGPRTAIRSLPPRPAAGRPRARHGAGDVTSPLGAASARHVLMCSAPAGTVPVSDWAAALKSIRPALPDVLTGCGCWRCSLAPREHLPYEMRGERGGAPHRRNSRPFGYVTRAVYC